MRSFIGNVPIGTTLWDNKYLGYSTEYLIIYVAIIYGENWMQTVFN